MMFGHVIGYTQAYDYFIDFRRWQGIQFLDILALLRLLDTYAAKTHENWPPLHISLNNSVTRPYFKM